MTTTRLLHVVTWGCQMNVYDSGRMRDLLKPLGYSVTPDLEKADLILLNTCHIREKATEKLFSELGRLRDLKIKRKEQEGKETLIGVAGCVAQAVGEMITKRAPWVDIVVGPQAYHKLPELIARISRNGKQALDLDFPTETKFDHLPNNVTNDRTYTAFLTVQEGCDKFCSYCVVPYTRGAEYSRSVSSILEEATKLSKEGVREITLLGQNVNGFHGENVDGSICDLGGLINHIGNVSGIDRIRYMTSHPNDMNQALIDAHASNPKLMPFIHLPVQSGSNKILSAMNRDHTREEYFEIIHKLREKRPDIALSSDFIVGFPGETDRDFEQTMDLVERVKFALAYSFKYSARPGTPAAGLTNHIDIDTQNKRLQALQALLRKQQQEFQDGLVGKTLDVLVTDKGRKDGQIMGRSPYLQPVHFQGSSELIGQIVKVFIEETRTNSLAGRLVDKD